MRNKKAAIEVQFNWIFVMIVGFVLFLFIIGIVVWNANNANTKICEDVIDQIVTTIRGKQQLSNTYNEVELTKMELSISCDQNTLISDIKSSCSQRQSLPIEIIFAPREIKTSKLIIATEDFNIPFVVTRFLYMTSPDFTFIINGNGQLEDRLFAEFPGNVSRVQVDMPAYSLTTLIKDHPTYKIICFEGACPADDKYDYIKIIPGDEGLFSYGTVVYHRKPINYQYTHYITKQGLLGAIFSDNKNYYECQMERVFKQFEIKRRLYHDRAELLQDDLPSENPECEPVMALPIETLEDMEGLGLVDYETIYEKSADLIENNIALEFESCPVIY